MEHEVITQLAPEDLIRCPCDPELVKALAEGRLDALVIRGDVRIYVDQYLYNQIEMALTDRTLDPSLPFEKIYLGRAMLGDWECFGTPHEVWEAYASLLPPEDAFLDLIGRKTKSITLYTLVYFDPAF